MQVAKPNLIFGIDFGMTCTGVAYANLIRGDVVRTVQRWPGRGQANENKVPTIIVYSKQTHEVSSWGFASESRLEQNNPDRLYVEWFKVYLDDELLQTLRQRDPVNCPASIEEVEKWFVDYLSALYKHLEFKLSQELPAHMTWSTALIEFIFSVPTTWAPHPTVERFRSILRMAGFNQYASHSVTVGLTEAEAAAVATSIEAPGMFRVGENLLVCDVGGGTTDLSVLRVENTTHGSASLKQVDVVIGRNIGSVKIDEAFEALVLERLQAANLATPLGIDLEDAAWLMMKSREYQNAKCDHGALDDAPLFHVPIPGLPVAYTNEPFGIFNGAMQFAQQNLRKLFDLQVARLYDLIDRQLSRFAAQWPGQTIAHLVLSGGLGNSPYIQWCLRTRYETGAYNLAVTQGLQIHLAPEPQLAVAKGIVHDRVRKLASGQSVLGWRCARASYGAVCKIPYDAKNPLHQGIPLALDPLDGITYVTRAVEWFICKGQAVNSDAPITRQFKKKLKPEELVKRSFPTSILVSHIDGGPLPLTMHHGNCEILCEVTSNLSMIPENRFKLKNRHWWNFARPYRRCNFDIRVLIGPADINFELWFDGAKISYDNPIQVEWQQTSAPPPNIVDGGDAALNTPAISKSRRTGRGL